MSDDTDRPVTLVSRRDALKSLGVAVPLLGVTASPEVERVARYMASLDEEQQPAFQAKFFRPHELRTVRMLVDYIIPKDERSVGANEAKVPEFIDFVMTDAVLTSEAQRVAMRGGLAWLDRECATRFAGKRFVEAADAERRQVLDDIAWPRKARPEMGVGVTFFNRMRDLTASGFFSSAAGWRDLQYMGHVFNPAWNGCPKPALDKLGVDYDLMKTIVRPDKP